MGQSENISRRRFLNLLGGSVCGLGILSTCGYVYATEIERGFVTVEPMQLNLPRLDKMFKGLRLVQISDIHMDDWMTQKRLASIVNLVFKLEPDLVAITGDFLTIDPDRKIPELVTVLKPLGTQVTTVAVLGNHDYWTDAVAVREMLIACNIIELGNTIYSLKHGNAELHPAGVDDIWEEHDCLDKVLDQLPPEGAAILLAHEPDFADTSAASGRFDLQISGHSHGGQVNLPFFGPPITPYLGQKYPAGLYRISEMYQYTNRGLGMVKPQVRFNCRPEVTLFILDTI